MTKRIAGTVLAILIAFAFVVGWAMWSNSGIAPYFVRTAFDHTARLFTDDPNTRCIVREQSQFGVLLGRISPRNCYDLSKPRRFQGVYIDQFEGQVFIPDAIPARRYIGSKETIWLTFDALSDRVRAPGVGRLNSRHQIWLVDFIGRETTRVGHYGHMGMSDSEIVVDELLAARPLQHFTQSDVETAGLFVNPNFDNRH